MNEDGTWSYSAQSCFNQFINAFPDKVVHHEYESFAHHQQDVVRRFHQSRSVCKGKSTVRPAVLTDTAVDDIQACIEHSPNKSIRKLSQRTGLLYGSCRIALKKKLHMHPYKISVVQHLYPEDYRKRIKYCNWFIKNLNNNDILGSYVFH